MDKNGGHGLEIGPEVITHRIFDFDGTLVLLNMDWHAARLELGVRSLRDIWTLPSEQISHSISFLAKMESTAAKAGRYQPTRLLGKLKPATDAILSNNGESTIREILLREGFTLEEVDSITIAGRESLMGPKEDFSVFLKGLGIIFGNWRSFSTSTVLRTVCYFGDSDYEVHFARDYGLQAVNVRLSSGAL